MSQAIGISPKSAHTADINSHIDEIKERGYTVVPGVFSANEVEHIRDGLEEIFARELKFGPDEFVRHPSYQISHFLITKNDLFFELFQHSVLLKMARAVLGNDCILSALNGIAMRPGGVNQVLHFDYNGVPGTTLSVTGLITLDTFTKENGATRLVPYSHKMKLPDELAKSDEETKLAYFKNDLIQVEAPVGSIIFYDGTILHGGTANRTQSKRRAIISVFCRSFIKPEWDFPRTIPDHIAATFTEEQLRLLGYYHQRPMRYSFGRASYIDPHRWPTRRTRVLSRIKTALKLDRFDI